MEEPNNRVHASTLVARRPCRQEERLPRKHKYDIEYNWVLTLLVGKRTGVRVAGNNDKSFHPCLFKGKGASK